MYCPACRGRLELLKLKSAAVDVCAECGGIWFDKGDLKSTVNELIAADSFKATDKQVLFTKRTINTPDQTESYRTCPRCSLAMKKTNFAYDSNVFVDKCKQCDGIWTDKGEMKEIAGFLKIDPQSQKLGKALIERDREMRDLDELASAGNALRSRSAIWYLFSPTFLLPLGDEKPAKTFPVITVSLIAVCLAVFVGQCIFVPDTENFFYDHGFYAWQFDSSGVVTSMFLHANIFHLIGNMIFLWVFGIRIEDRFGRVGFPFFYLASGLSASMLLSVFTIDASIPVVGASGCVSGIMGAYLIFYPKARLKVFWMGRIIHIPAFLFLIIWFAFQLLYALIFMEIDSSNVAWFSHVGGFVFGVATAFIMKKYTSADMSADEVAC
jgi:membrane associated rhomboid family serine protease